MNRTGGATRTDDLVISTRVPVELVPRLWELYATAFEPLGEAALLAHLYPRDLFEDLVSRPEVFKVVGRRGGQLAGFAAVTNELELVPQISPAFLRSRYPDAARRDAIFFAMFICVAPPARHSTMFAKLISGLGQVAAVRGGLVVCDMSKANRDAGLGELIGRIVEWFPGSGFEEIDSQHYFAATLPVPLERLPFSDQPAPVPQIDLRDPDEEVEEVGATPPERSGAQERSGSTESGTGRPKR